MLYVDKNNNIRLTRGDTAKFVVSVQSEVWSTSTACTT